MIKSKFLLVLFLVATNSILAQNNLSISGTVRSMPDTTAVTRAIVSLKNGLNITLTYSFTDNRGGYNLSATIYDTGVYYLEVKNIRFLTTIRIIYVANIHSAINHDVLFYLTPSPKELEEVIVKSIRNVRENKDTVEYKAEAYRKIDTRKVEDLLKNIDGFSVDANGKISYRGKTVKALLINDDDMTRENYGVLTKNLNAALIDKVQVFNNYSENSVVGSVLKTNEVAVNLKLDEKIQNTTSGSLSLGMGLASKLRYEVDGNLLWMGSRLKFIELANSNSIASKQIFSDNRIQPVANNDRVLGLPPEAIFLKRVTISSIYNPPITEPYCVDNIDALGSSLIQYNLTKKVKLNARVDVSTLGNRNTATDLITTIPDAVTKWEIFSQKKSETKTNSINSNIFFNHDNKNNVAGFFSASFNGSNLGVDFSNNTAGFLIDTLRSKGNIKAAMFDIRYSNFLKLNSHSLLKSSIVYQYIYGNERAGLLTNRLSAFYSYPTDSVYSYYQQHNSNRNALYADIQLLVNKEKNIFNQISIIYQKEAIRGDKTFRVGFPLEYPNAKSIQEKNLLISNLSSSLAALNLLGAKAVGKNIYFKPSWLIGIETYRLANSLPNANHSAVWDIKNEITLKKKAFGYWSFSLNIVQRLPGIHNYYPDTLFSGNETFFLASDKLDPIRNYSIDFGFSTYNLHKGRSMFGNVWAKYASREYKNSFILNPRIGLHQLIPVEGTKNYGLIFTLKQLILPFKINVVLHSLLHYDIDKNQINEVWVEERTTSLNYSAKIITSFNGYVNGELSINRSHYFASQINVDEKLTTNIGSYTIQGKMRYQPSTRFYIGLQSDLYKMENQKLVGLLDCFSAYIFSKKISLDIKVHNLLNLKKIANFQASPNVVSIQYFPLIKRYLFFRINWSI